MVENNSHSSLSARFDLFERTLLMLASGLILLSWTAIFFTDINYPQGIRLARIAAVTIAIAIGVLEYMRPWAGFCAFILLWPQLFVIRDLFQHHISASIGAMPMISGGPIAAALALGFALRTRFKAGGTGVQASPPYEPVRAIQWSRIALWALTIVWIASAISATARLFIAPPAGWHVDRPDWRHLSSASAFSMLVPALSLLRVLPEFLLSLLLLNSVARRNSRPDSSSPVDAFLTCLGASAVLIAGQIIVEQITGWSWSFDDNPPSGPFNNRNTASPVLIIFSLLCFYAAGREGFRKILWLALSAGLFVVACTISSRNGLFMAGSMLVIVLVLKLKRRWLALFPAILALWVCLWMPLPNDEPRNESARRIYYTLQQLRAGDWDTFTSRRSELYRSAVNIFREYPVTGSGPGTFPMLAAPGAKYQVVGTGAYFAAHSVPLNLLAETGPIGVLAWLALWLVIPVFALWRNPDSKWLWLAVLIFGLGNMLDTVWLTTGVATFATLVIYCACWESAEKRIGAMTAATDSRT